MVITIDFTTWEWNAVLSPSYLKPRSDELGMHDDSRSSSLVREHEFMS